MTRIFVFGSNLAGRHGRGSALEAAKLHGAVYGQGEGLQGKSYAIPTKNFKLQSLPLSIIKEHVETFLVFAGENPDMVFNIVAIGTGLAGYGIDQIAPFFREAPPNCNLPKSFIEFLK